MTTSVATGSRERIRAIVAGEQADRCGLWLGNPHRDTWPILHAFFGTATEEELRRKLGDDFRWINPGFAYRHPAGKPMFDTRRRGVELSAAGAFADCKDVREVDDFEWPDPAYLDFTETLQRLKDAGDVYRASGFWCPFFHNVADFFGMEGYFVKMYTHPEVVHAVTERVVDFYLEANTRLFSVAGDLIDGFFFGNDFGTQRDLIISPDCFDEFVFPYFRKLTDLGHANGLQVILHSCGSIYKVMPKLIELGVDALHPLQAKAENMAAETLGDAFSGSLAFVGGIDTQDLLVHATPGQVKDDVRRVKTLLGPRLVVSPSHEAVLPNVPPENLLAMAEAAVE
jgi:uroporphyrinogen decarboxylase